MNYCLLPKLADEFKQRLRSGQINPEKLNKMSSKERHDFFESFLPKADATNVNALFESKLLLKNQQAGFVTWAKQVSGISKQSRRDIISRIEKMDKVLDPANEKAFLEELASKKLGTDITFEEAKIMHDLSKKVQETKSKMNEETFTFETTEARLEHGRAKVDLMDYVADLKVKAEKLTLEEAKNNPIGTIIKGTSRLGGLAKSMKATLDNSVIGRQGLKVMFTNPKVWLKNSLKTFDDIVKTFEGKDVIREVKADVLSRPNALNGLYTKEKLAVGVKEEAFPTSLPQRIPGLGRAFKASEAAFTSFQYRTRADIFDRYVQVAQASGVDFKGIGKLANSLTGRGSFSMAGEASLNVTNNVFFSPRFLKANFDTLTGHALQYKDLSPFARKQAAVNLVKVVVGIGTVLAIADSVSPGSVEWDSRSSDFGKIKVGDTRFDVAGGMSSLVVLATRFIRGSSKSSSSGKIRELNSQKFGAQTKIDLFYNFFENKLSPLAGVVRDLARDETFEGERPTVESTIKSLTVPLPASNYLELRNNPDSANDIAAMIADMLGIGINTYK